VTTHLENLEKSVNSKWSGKSQGKWKKSGEVKSGVFFQVLNTPKLDAPPGPVVGWGGGHPIPFPSCYNPNCRIIDYLASPCFSLI